ncbi:Deoxyribose-phosphate aldolase [Lunatimonas lonarensis]|uniref:Deoxyribose-phosphate aldolase n=1 Tax=Lunatimonas lonarensis TaxID=1232681 RepID=R7ZMB7_9BACT|nr:deoxyribose-phosphate aldolase [Lunatimonas lonarensis]EON75243.1 Deoxyribose-phosphate aldolase [Lunatimonas lonarensis]
MKNLNRYLEHTLLKPDCTQHEIEMLLTDCRQYRFMGVCVPPFWVKKVKRDLSDMDIQVVTVVGFPFGYSTTEAKVHETVQAIRDGADEIDVVWSLTAYKSGMNWPKIELAKLSQLCHEEGRLIKVIVETAFLDESELLEACDICRDAGADFVKTSTGFAPGGAVEEQIRLMRSRLPSQVGIKASGGIRDLPKAIAMIKAGADRIGTSAGPSIMNALEDA